MLYRIIFTDENNHKWTTWEFLPYDAVVKEMSDLHSELAKIGSIRHQPCSTGRAPLETIQFTRDNKGICSYSVSPMS